LQIRLPRALNISVLSPISPPKNYDFEKLFNREFGIIKEDEFVKSLRIVMPDLIRHPELIEFTGFRLSPE